jgi:copper chaperone CopZ
VTEFYKRFKGISLRAKYTTVNSIIALLAAVIAALTGCYRQEVKKFEISVPDMVDGRSALIVSNAVASLRGVLDVDLDREERRLAVSYNSLSTAQKNIEQAVAEAGYDANSLIAVPKSISED